MPEIEIANARDLPPQSEWPPHFVYVGRANPRRGLKESPLANPWGIGPGYTREKVLELFRWCFGIGTKGGGISEVWEDKVRELNRLRAVLTRYGRLTLVCWCAPKPCHAEVIKEYLEADHA